MARAEEWTGSVDDPVKRAKVRQPACHLSSVTEAEVGYLSLGNYKEEEGARACHSKYPATLHTAVTS